MAAPSQIFVTHVEAEGPFVKICGQTSQRTMEEVNAALRAIHVALLTETLQPALQRITSTEMYLVQPSPDQFARRCLAVDVKRTGQVRVYLIDYGSEIEVNVSQVSFSVDTYFIC